MFPHPADRGASLELGLRQVRETVHFHTFVIKNWAVCSARNCLKSGSLGKENLLGSVSRGSVRTLPLAPLPQPVSSRRWGYCCPQGSAPTTLRAVVLWEEEALSDWCCHLVVYQKVNT